MKKIIIKINQHSALALWAAIFLYIAIFGAIAVWKYINFRYNGLDLAIFNQTFYNTSLGNIFGLTIHPPTYLIDHFSPFILALTPAYLPFRHPLAIIIFLQITLALSAWPIYMIAKNLLPKPWPLAIGLAFLANPFVQNLSLFEFSLLPFSLPVLLLAFWCYQKNRLAPFLALATFALLVREDVTLAVFAFGLLALIDKKSFKWIFWPIIISTVYFALASSIISAVSVSGGYKFLIYYSWLGSSWPEIIKNILLKPWLIMFKLFSLPNLEMILGFLLPFAFLPIIKPKYLILAIFIFLQIIMGAPGGSNLILNTQYTALFLPALFISFIYALERVHNLNFNGRLANLLQREKNLTILMIGAAVLYGSAMLGPLPGTIKLMAVDRNISAADIQKKIVSLVPPTAPVVATYDLITPLSSRPEIYSFNYFFIGRQQFGNLAYALPKSTEYLAINTSEFLTYAIQYQENPLYRDNYRSAGQRVRDRIKEDNFGVVEVVDAWVLFNINNPTDILLYEILNTEPAIQIPQLVKINGYLEFLGSSRPKLSTQLLPMSFYWRATKTVPENYYLRLTILDGNKKIASQKIYPMAYGLYPTVDWTEGQIVKTNHWFIPTRPLDVNRQYGLTLELLIIKKGGLYVEPDRSVALKLENIEVIGSPIELGEISF